MLPHERQVAHDLRALQPGDPACPQQRLFHRVAASLQDLARGRRRCRAPRRGAAFCFRGGIGVSFGQVQFARGEYQTLHRHPVLGEGARLVGQDHGRGAERLDGRQALDQRVPPRHPPHPARERQGRDDGQAFRDGCDRQRNAGLGHEAEVLAGRDAKGGEEDGHPENRPDHLLGKALQVTLQGRTVGLGLLDEAGDGTEFCA